MGITTILALCLQARTLENLSHSPYLALVGHGTYLEWEVKRKISFDYLLMLTVVA